MKHLFGPVYRDEKGELWEKARVPNPYARESYTGLDSRFWRLVVFIYDYLRGTRGLK